MRLGKRDSGEEEEEEEEKGEDNAENDALGQAAAILDMQ